MLASELRIGTIYKEDGQPYKVEKYSHKKIARASATIRVKVRNLLTDAITEKTYNSSSKVDDADVFRKRVQYLYKDSGYVFMDPQNYEQFTISEDILGDQSQYLIEGTDIQVMLYEGNPVSVDLPLNLVYKVEYTEPGFKGNTVTNTLKDATMTNGLVAKVPTFVKIGDKVKIDTRTGEYVSKA